MGPVGADDLPTRPKNLNDAATPAGNGTMVEVLARLYQTTGETRFLHRAEALVDGLGRGTVDDLFARTSLGNAFDFLVRSIHIVIAGDPADPRTRDLIAVAARAARPPRLLIRVSDTAPLPDFHPAHGKGPIDGNPAAYVCSGMTCERPLTDPRALQARLGSP